MFRMMMSLFLGGLVLSCIPAAKAGKTLQPLDRETASKQAEAVEGVNYLITANTLIDYGRKEKSPLALIAAVELIGKANPKAGALQAEKGMPELKNETLEPQQLLREAQALADADPKLADHLKRVQCPVLLVWGENDQVVPPAYAQAYKQCLPQAELKLLPNCGHLPMFEQETAFVEAVTARVAEETPGLTVRRGAAVRGVLTGAPAHDGVPHVTGVELEDGERIDADLVVDATGRRSPLARWIADAGGPTLRRTLRSIISSRVPPCGRSARSRT